MPAQTQDINKLLELANNLYEVAMVVARRSRQINEEHYQKKRDRQILEELEGGFEEDFLNEDEEASSKANAEPEENPINHALDDFKATRLEFQFETLRR